MRIIGFCHRPFNPVTDPFNPDPFNPSFVPSSRTQRRTSIYVERAYLPGHRPDANELACYQQAVIEELRAWGYITNVEVLDPTWVEVAYTWACGPAQPGAKRPSARSRRQVSKRSAAMPGGTSRGLPIRFGTALVPPFPRALSFVDIMSLEHEIAR